MAESSNRAPRAFFVCLVLALFGAFLPFREAIRDKAARDHQELVDQARERLASANLSQTAAFSPEHWIRNRGQAFLASARQRIDRRGFSPALAEKLGRELAKCFPGAVVFAFDQAGKLVFQTGREAKRSRELFWEGVLAFQREHGGDPQDKRIQMADRFCKGLYGALTTLSDLTSSRGLPRRFLEKGKTRISWVFPQEFLDSPGTPPPATGTGGLWLLIDPGLLPTRKIAEQALRNFPETADVLALIRNSHGKPRLEMQLGRGRLPASTATRFFRGTTECEDTFGCWVGRYIPGQNGRFLIAGVRAKNLEGFFGAWGRALQTTYLLLALVVSGVAYRLFWKGQSPALNLRPLVFILFALVAVFPFVAVVFQGLDLARDNARRSRNTWENRIKAVLGGIDSGAALFREEQVKKLAAIETDLAATLPLSPRSTVDLQRLCGDMDHFDALVIDERGGRLNISRSLEKVQKKGEYPSYMARQLAHLLETEGRVPIPALASAPTLLSGHHLETLLSLLFRHFEEFDRLRIARYHVSAKKIHSLQAGNPAPREHGAHQLAF